MPATPPPMTTTFFLPSPGFRQTTSSRAAWGFTAQETGSPVSTQRRKQPMLQPMQGRMSSILPEMTLLG